MTEHKLPKPSAGTILRPEHPREKVYTADQMRAYAEQYAARAVAAEREACAKLCDVTPPYPFRPSIEAAHAIRALRSTK